MLNTIPKSQASTLISVLVLGAFPVLAGCGSSKGGETVPEPSLPGTPALTLVLVGESTLHFTWEDVDGETEYRLMEDPDGTSGFSRLQVLPRDRIEHEIVIDIVTHRSAIYCLDACNRVGCARSNVVPVAAAVPVGFTYFKASHPGSHDGFGETVSLSGDGNTLVVGASKEQASARGVKHPSDPDFLSSQIDRRSHASGAAYVFRRWGDAWVQEAYLKASNADEGDTFGRSVAISYDGNTIAVGAPREDGNGVGGEGDNSMEMSGAVYVYVRVGDRWYPEFYIKAKEPDEGNLFGLEIVLSGDGKTLAVGAGGDSSGVPDDPTDETAHHSGGVHVFVQDASFWYEQAYLKAPAIDAHDFFGQSLALAHDGTLLAVGYSGEDSNGPVPGDNNAMQAGAVMVYERDGLAWDKQWFVKAPEVVAAAHFGADVSLSSDGELLAVGAPFQDGDGSHEVPATLDIGAVYIFERTEDAWVARGDPIWAPNPDQYDRFGNAVALSENVLVVGAFQESGGSRGFGGDMFDNSSSASGAAYVFESLGGPFVRSPRYYVKAPNADEDDQFGYAIAVSDGGRTFAVGARHESSSAAGIDGDMLDNGVFWCGAAYLFETWARP